MSSVDDRIVSMTFDNGKFLKNVGETMSAMDKLDRSLQMDGAAKGITDVQGAVDRFSMANMAQSVDSIQSKFSVFGAIAFSAIQRLTNAAIDLGKKLVTSVIDPLWGGGKKRALNLEQAHFQFEGLGMNVEKTMESALTAVKGTAYGLDEAAVAASMFGASGMKAGDDMTKALRAISGVAAMTGSEYSDISRIFTSVAGNGRLMGDDLLQLAGRGVNAAATLGEAMNKTEAEVRDMVSSGEISFEMFYNAMDNAFGEHATRANETYTGSLANMRAALARIGAAVWTPALEKQRDIFNAITPAIDRAAEALGPFIDAMAQMFDFTSKHAINFFEGLDFSGLSINARPIIQTVKNLFQALMSVVKPIKDAFTDIFPPATATQVLGLSRAIEKFTEHLTLSGDTANNLRRTFAGVFAIFSIAGQIISGLIGMFANLITSISGGDSVFLNFTGGIGDFLVAVDKALKEGELLSNFFKTLGVILEVPVRILQVVAGLIAGLFSAFDTDEAGNVDTSLGRIEDRLDPMRGLLEKLSGAFAGLGRALSAVKDFFQPVIDAFKEFFSNLGSSIAEALGQGDFSPVFDAINATLLGGIALLLKDFVSRGLAGFIGGVSTVSFSRMFRELTLTMEEMQAQIKAKTLMLIASAIAILTASIVALSMIDSAKLTKALTAMSVGFIQLLGALAILNKITKTAGFSKLPLIAFSLILLATAIRVLTGAVKNLSDLSWNGLLKGLSGVAVLLTGISFAVKPLTANSGGMIRAGVGLVAVAVGIRILTNAVKAMADLSWHEMVRGLVGVAGAMAVLIGAMMLMPKNMGKQAASLVVLGVALNIIAKAVGSFAGLSWNEIVKGFVGLAGSLVLIAGAMMLMPQNMVAQAAALVLVGAALNLISNAVIKMGGMSWEEIAKGLITLAGALAILAAGLYLMTGAIAGAASLIIAAHALAILAPVMVTLGSMSWEAIAKGLVAIAGAFTVLGLAGLLLTPVIPVILSLSAALALIGAGFFLAGSGALMLATAITALVAAGAAGTAVLVAALEKIVELIPDILANIAKGFVRFLDEITKAGPTFVKAFSTMLSAVLDAITRNIPKIGKLMNTLIRTGLDVLRKNIPRFVDAGIEIILGFLRGVDRNINEIIDRAASITVKFIRGIERNMGKIINAGVDLVIEFVNSVARAIENNTDRMNEAGGRLARAIISGLTSGLSSGIGGVASAGFNLGRAAFNAAMSAVGANSPAKEFIKIGEYSGEGMAIGLKGYSRMVEKESENLANKALDTIKYTMSGINSVMDDEDALSPVVTPVLDLTKLQKDAAGINRLVGTKELKADVSYGRAAAISEDRLQAEEVAQESAKEARAREIKFEQNNYSPKSLSPIEIYRQTRNQLSLAEEALKDA